MSEMIERAAKAFRAALVANCAGGDCVHEKSCGYIDFQSCDDEAIARAIIAAMRDPTEAMLIGAARKAAEDQCRTIEIHRIDVADIYQAMIDEALK